MEQAYAAGLEMPPRLINIKSPGVGEFFKGSRRVENRFAVLEVAVLRDIVELAEQPARFFAEHADHFIGSPDVELALFAFAVGVFR